MSMKIERSTLDQVKARFAQNKKKLEEKKKDYDLEQRVKELKEEVCFISKIVALLISLFYLLCNFYRKKRLRNIGKKKERIRKGRSRKWTRMRDLLMKWRQLWDFPVLVLKKSDRLPIIRYFWTIYTIFEGKYYFFGIPLFAVSFH